jgi:prepilin-type N-terminal cleavage/methylation domain-containing protein
MNRKPEQFRPTASGGFTLIELMVSIALVLILILGINQVFKIASDTVNGGTAISAAAREDRAIQGTMYPDFQNVVLADAPYFIIRSRLQPAFRNKADEQADRDGDPYTVDVDGNNKEGEANIPGEKISAVTISPRNHRLDRLMFFSNYLYRRQTGATKSQVISDLSSNEAYIWYGHLKVGRNNPVDINDYYLPGENSQGDNGKYLQESRFDVANTSIADYRRIVLDPRNWGATSSWWNNVSDFRFQAYPYPTRPLDGDTMARTVPIFVRGCTQFIVEYAGDYLDQSGDPTNASFTAADTVYSNPPKTDGVIDYVLVNGARRTRWYGAPRNVDFSDDKPGQPMIRGTGQARLMLDVVPLRDVLKSVGITIDPVNFIEPEIDRRLPPQANYAAVAGTPPRTGQFTSPVIGSGGPTGNEYVAAWGPTAAGHLLGRGSIYRPKLIRITIVVDDPAGRMTEGQTYEYVFKLP